MNDFAAAKEAYEASSAASALVKPGKRTPIALAAHHRTMEPLAAACRDAATTEQDRCRWDIRWHRHWVASSPPEHSYEPMADGAHGGGRRCDRCHEPKREFMFKTAFHTTCHACEEAALPVKRKTGWQPKPQAKMEGKRPVFGSVGP